MIIIVKEFNNGTDDCLTIKSNNENKVLLEKTTGIIYEDEVDILKSNKDNFDEVDKPVEEEE